MHKEYTGEPRNQSVPNGPCHREKNLFRIISNLAVALTFVFLALASNAKLSQAADAKSIASLARSSDPEIATNAKQLVSMLQFRNWKSTAGTNLRARFGGIKDRKIILVKSDGEVAVPMQALSAEDQSFLLGVFTAESNMLAAIAEAMKAHDLSMTQLEGELKKLRTELATAHETIGRTKPPANAETSPKVLRKHLEAQGEKYVGMRVKFIGVTRVSIKNSGFFEEAKIKAYVGGALGKRTEVPDWGVVNFSDSENKLFQNGFAKNSDFADLILDLNSDEKVNVYGTVQRYQNGGKNIYGITIEAIEKTAD